MSEIFRRGDIVQNEFGPHSYQGCPLVCGSGAYTDAIVVQPDPLILVSREGDMMWSCIREERKHLKVIGFATPEQAREAFNRLRRERGEEEDTGDHPVEAFESSSTNFGRVDEVKKPTASVMIKIDGKVFRCDCGCNVFNRPPDNPHVYECNACEAWYRGFKK